MTTVICKNDAAFSLRFRICWDSENGTTNSYCSHIFSKAQEGNIILSGYNLSEGQSLWIEVHALMTGIKQSDQRIIYNPSAPDPIFKVMGATEHFTIALE